MDFAFDPALVIEHALREAALETPGFGREFEPQVRGADPQFGDFQANGVLPFAKKTGQNPRALATALLTTLQARGRLDPAAVGVELAGPGFLNFRLRPRYLHDWLMRIPDAEALATMAGAALRGRVCVVDYSSPNTAKEMHVGHIRSTVIGESIARLLAFLGAHVIRDNHIGDWGTQFGMLIWAIKRQGFDVDAPPPEAIAALEGLYQAGSKAFKESGEGDGSVATEIREELVKLQQGDAENMRIWQRITEISWTAFAHIYEALGIRFDHVLGESFYRDRVDHVYRELQACGLAVEDQGALVVFFPDHPRFATQPFIVRKADGASNYASTDLATVLFRTEAWKADEVIYVVDARQSDHFEQLFLTVRAWYERRGWTPPRLRHVSFGTVLGENGKPIKTKEGGSVKLRELLREAVERAAHIVAEKNPDLSREEQERIARVVGLGAVKYADLSQNRSSDYVFSWDKMLALEGNTAPYLLYAGARIHSILRKLGLRPGEGTEGASVPETAEELALARKLVGFPGALEQACGDLRPHLLCTYLYELTGVFGAFYKADKVMVDEEPVRARRLLLCARTLLILETGLGLLGLETLERM